MGGLRTVAKRLIARSAAVAIVGGLVAAPMALGDPTPVYYPLPTATHVTGGTGMVTDPSGNVWFTANDSSANQGPVPHPPIGKLVPSQAQVGTSDGITLYRTPNGFANPSCCATFVRSLAFDNIKNQLWYARSDGSYGYGDPTAMVPETETGFSAARLPSGIGLWGVAVDQNTHKVYFAENGATNAHQASDPAGYYAGNRLALTDSGLGVTDFPNLAQQGGEQSLVSTRYPANPIGVSIAPDGTPWFAEANGGIDGYRIARGNGAGGSYTEWCLNNTSPCQGPTTNGGSTDTAVAPNGTVWFLIPSENVVGSFEPTTQTLTKYFIGSFDPTNALNSSSPSQLRFAPDGTLWLSEQAASLSSTTGNAIIRIDVSGAAPVGNIFKTGGFTPGAIGTSVTGDVWFSAFSNFNSIGSIGRLQGVIAGGTDPGTTPTPTPGPGTPTPAPGTPTPTPKPSTITDPGVTATPTLKGVAKPADPSPKGTDLSLNQVCVGPPQDKCSLVYLIATHEYVAGFPGSGARLSAKPKSKTDKKHQKIGGLSVVLNGGETRQITIPLSAKAKKALKKQGHIKATLTVSQVIDAAGHTKVIQTKNVTFKYKAPKKGH